MPSSTVMILRLTVTITPDETMPGTSIARVEELDVSTVLRDGEDPWPVLDDLVGGTLSVLSELGRLEETLRRLTGAAGSVAAPLIADFNLRRQSSIEL